MLKHLDFSLKAMGVFEARQAGQGHSSFAFGKDESRLERRLFGQVKLCL